MNTISFVIGMLTLGLIAWALVEPERATARARRHRDRQNAVTHRGQ